MAIPEGYEKLAVIGIAYKGEYDPETEYHIMNAVYYEGSTYVALKEHPEGVPTADGANWMYLAKGFIQNMLDTVNAKDTSGLLGEPGGVVSAQTLMDKIADKMTKELVTNTALQNKLANYILKSQIVNNLLATQPGNPLDATQGKILADKFAQLNSEFELEYISNTTNFIELKNGYDFTDSKAENYMLKYGRIIEIQLALIVTGNDLPNVVATIIKNKPYRSIKIYGYIASSQWGVPETILYVYIGSDGLININKPSTYTDDLTNKHISINAVYLS
ncbi:MAG TPA: hypothetical protein IAA05_16015 [Candidatus Blautia excrementipullorum]|nr:hypothetical protein [Candidatus Blautia excrementipullorum]